METSAGDGHDGLVFDLADPGGISAQFWAKLPGPTMRLGRARMSFSFADSFGTDRALEAYERLIHDAMLGDRTLFTRADGIERTWEVSQPVLDADVPVLPYAPGLMGPGRRARPHRPAPVAPAGGLVMGLRGGLDLGGTKVQAAILDPEGNALGSARHPTPTSGGPPDVAATLVAALKEAAEAAGTEPAALEGVGVGSPGEIDPDAGTVGQRGNLPELARAVPAGLGAAGGGRRARAARQRRLGGHRGRVRARLGPPLPCRCSASSGVPASAAGSSSTAGCGSGAPRRARSATWCVKLGGARCPCGREGCLEAYAGRGVDGGARRRAAGRAGREDGALRDHGEARPAAPDERGVGARARARRRPGDRAHRRRGGGAGRRHRVGAGTSSTWRR